MASFGVGSIVAKVEADVRDFQTKMNGVRDNLSEVEESGYNVNTMLGGLGAAFTAMGLLGVGAMKQMTDKAREFNDSFTHLEIMTGEMGDKAQQMGETSRDLFRRGLGGTYGEINEVIAYADSHLDGSEKHIDNMTEKALQLKNALGLDPNNVLYAISRGEHHMNEDGNDIYDVLLSMYQNTGENANEITALVAEHATDFEDLGYSIQDMGDKVIYGMENGAANVGDIMSIYRNFRTNMENMNDDFVRGLLRLRIDPNEALANFNKGGEAAKQQVDEIINQIGKLEDSEALQRRLMSSIFGANEQGIGSDFFENYADSMQIDGGYDGRFDKFMEHFEENNIAWNINKLKNEVSDLMTTVGSEYLPLLLDTVKGMREFVEVLGKILRENPGLAKFAAGFLAIFSAVNLVLGIVFSGLLIWNKFGGAIGRALTMLGGFFETLSLYLMYAWDAIKKFAVRVGGTLLRGAINPIVLAIMAGIGVVKTLYEWLEKAFGSEAAQMFLNLLFPIQMLEDALSRVRDWFIKILPESVRHFADVFFNIIETIYKGGTLPLQMLYNFIRGESLNPLEIMYGNGNQTVNINTNNLDGTNAGSVGSRAARELRGQRNGMIT